VFDQMPPVETVTLLGDKIFIQTGTTAELPDFTGWTRTQISQFGQLLGLDIRINGTGTGASQTMRAGRRVRAGDTLTVTLD
jgi:penicillin-binding protein 2B